MQEKRIYYQEHNMQQIKGQLTLRGLVIGCVGCVIITAASVYTALKMGALPWPIVFAAIISLVFLKATRSREASNGAGRGTGDADGAGAGETDAGDLNSVGASEVGGSTPVNNGILNKNTSGGLLNEVNVTHTIMSAGAMVAGGLAFTIPGIWMLGHASEVSWWQMLIVALAGVALGLVCCVFLRRHFLEKAKLEFPIGQAAAQTILAGNSSGKVKIKLFGAMGVAGLYTFLRDWLSVLPTLLFNNIGIPGVAFGIYNSPMLLAVGFLVGTTAVVVWFAGALLGNFGIIVGGTALNLWDLPSAQNIVTSLGMGVMMGAGAGVILKILLPGLRLFRPKDNSAGDAELSLRSPQHDKGNAQNLELQTGKPDARFSLRSPQHDKGQSQSCSPTTSKRGSAAAITLVMAAVATLLCFALELGPLPSLAVVAMAWLTCAMSSQSVGQTGIDPMEIFGLIVLLLIAAFANTTLVQLFFVAAVIAVACGLAGDVMNDFKAGQIIGTNPRAQWLGQAVGGVLGALTAVAVMVVLLQAYGPDAFGIQGSFVCAQASVVSTMISGIPSPEAFAVGLGAGLVLTVLGAPAMMLGLGIYLPFYLSFSAFLGAMAKLLYDFLARRRGNRSARASAQASNRAAQEKSIHQKSVEQTGLVIASGLLGGESIVGVLVALAAVAMALF
jgi:uncharacterized oligopeptide transporter (OPT) family protein